MADYRLPISEETLLDALDRIDDLELDAKALEARVKALERKPGCTCLLINGARDSAADFPCPVHQ